MAWAALPVTADTDYIDHDQWHEIYLAIKEREDAVGITPNLTEQTAADNYIEAAHINYYRGKVEALFPYFANESTGETWTKSAVLNHVLGQSDWTRIPARDGGLTTGDVVADTDYIYAEHANELQDVINELMWAIFECENFSGPVGDLMKHGENEGGSDWATIRGNAFSNCGAASPYTDTGDSAGTNADAYETDIGWLVEAEFWRKVGKATLGTLPAGGITDAKLCFYNTDSAFDQTVDEDTDFYVYYDNNPSPSTAQDFWDMGDGNGSIGDENSSAVANVGASWYYLMIDIAHGSLATSGTIGIKVKGDAESDRASWSEPGGYDEWDEFLDGNIRLILQLDFAYEEVPAP